MKNKIILVFLIFIFNSGYFNFLLAEEFKFDTTELQITENGNLIKGIDGGIITTKNNEIVITADTFIYNKFTTLLEAEGNVKLVDKIEDIIIETNKICIKEVRITTCVDIPNKYIIAGTSINPPPTPIIAANIPITILINKGGIMLIYNLDLLNFILNGRP